MADRDGTVLIVTPPPTPNGPLHLGHLAGPYVAGDIAARALRAAGRRVLTQCGLDANQNYVLTRSQARGESVEQTAAHFSALVRGGLAAARVEYDIMLDPLGDEDYRAAVPRLLGELVDAKAVDVAPARLSACGGCGRILHHARVAGSCPSCGTGAAGGTCEGCGEFRTATDLAGARSTCCDAPPVPVELTVPVLRLEEHRERLCEFWSRAVLPPRLRRLIGSYLDGGLPEVPLAYPTDWGLGWPTGDPSEMRVDVWAEMAVANLYAPARALDPGARTIADCVRAWRGIDEHWLFLGVDNAFYYAIMIPALHFAAGLPDGPTGLVVNEFYRLTGAKFSTSRDHAIWAHEHLAHEDAGLVRAFLSWDRPDAYESDFTPAAYETFRERYAAARRAVDAAAGNAASTDNGGGGGTGAAGATAGDLALADIELTRGEQALRPADFAPAVAVRAGLAAATARPERAGPLLDLIAGVG